MLRARAEATAATVQVARRTAPSPVDDARDDRALDVGTWIFAADGASVERPPGSAPALDRRGRGDLAGRGARHASRPTCPDPVRLLRPAGRATAGARSRPW